jgi:hypothetical protein
LNQTGKTPVFRILNKDETGRALAMAAISFLNTQAEVKPKIPMHEYLDAQFQELRLEPSSGNEVALFVKVSGYEIPLDKKIRKDDFLAGKTFEIPFPKGERQLVFFTIDSSGNLKFRLDKKTGNLILDDVTAKLNYSSQMGQSGKEFLHFTGRGIRR